MERIEIDEMIKMLFFIFLILIAFNLLDIGR